MTRALAAGALLLALPVGAQTACEAPTAARAAATRAWPAVLGRTVALQLDGVPLAAALEQLAAAAGLRFSYSADLLPGARRVCLARAPIAVGDALVELLAGTGVAPVAAGGNQVVLAPERAAAATGGAAGGAPSVNVLDRVVVTGTANGGPRRASPFAIEVLDGRALERSNTRSLAQALDAAVPGLWVWTQSPTSLLARYGSVRGSSSFGVTAPKIYIDGVEVANPLLLTRFDPAGVERVEVIRGPQGAALYGADAISGVVNIVTRHDGVGVGAPAAELRASAGGAASAYAAGGVLVQDHGLSLRAGSAARSAALAVSAATVGAFVPGGSSREVAALGTARLVGARTVATGTARLTSARAGAGENPLTARAAFARPTSDSTAGAAAGALDSGVARGDQRESQYTVGGSVSFQPSARWTHSVIAGVDGYRLAGLSRDGLPIPSTADSALLAARGGADRGTLRLSSTARLPLGPARSATLTVGLEQSGARESATADTGLVMPRAWGGAGGGGPHRATAGPGPALGAAESRVSWWSNTGLLAQGQFALGDRVFVSGGGRAEWIRAPGAGAQLALLPMLGTAYVHERGPVTLKARAAFGRGIRPARTGARGGTWSARGPMRAFGALEPEEQAGVEAGGDLLVGRAFGLHVTRFDQRASGLVQPVLVAGDSSEAPPGGGRGGRRVGYALQNVGAIVNRGWELQASGAAGPIALVGTLALVSSRVDEVAAGYGGELRVGDRALEVPARTAGLTASYNGPRWSGSWSVVRADNWINYDRAGLVRDLASGDRTPPELLGARLRDYWRRYDGVTRMRASATVRVWRTTALTLSGENLLDRQRGEPDNTTILPGRTLAVGARTAF